MILQSLVDYYEALLQKGEISPPGWGDVKISYALYINDKGELERAVCIRQEVELPSKSKKKEPKKILKAQELRLPAPVKRSSGISPNFLWDNSSYILGIDAKGKPERSKDCFEAAKQFHLNLLSQAESPAAKALCRFFQNWDPDKASEHPALVNVLEDILAGANLVFRYDFAYVHDDPEIQEIWNRHYNSDSEEPETICLVTGEKSPAEEVHPALKGVDGAQSSGAALVSFNSSAFWSYGKEGGANAPIGKYAAFAYTTALNYLLSQRDNVMHMGDASIVFWAKDGSQGYQDLMSGFFNDAPSPYEASELLDMVKHLCQGESVLYEESQLDPDMEFFILGLSPNSARLSVRFFLRNSFGHFLQNVMAHHERMNIVRPSFDPFETIPVWKMLSETVNQNSRNKSPAPNLAGETLRSILNDSPYPALLLNGVNLRIRAEHEINRGRAAIIKAYYLKNPNKDVPKEVLTVSLNPESKNIPYTLGRLFSVLEAVQSSANPNINTTIKDRYFNSASATPAHVFPVLMNLTQKHLKKLKEDSWKVYYDKQITALMAQLGETFPTHMSIPEQGAFQLGYYHQTQERYTKKQDKEEQ